MNKLSLLIHVMVLFIFYFDRSRSSFDFF